MMKNIKKIFHSTKSLIFPILILMIIMLIIQPMTISGQSMYPTLNNKDYVFVNKVVSSKKSIDRGDIVVTNSNLIDAKTGKNKKIIKRVIGLPGDHLEIKNGEVYINGDLYKEEYLSTNYTEGYVDIIVPFESIFVMGDNRQNSEDSRNDSIGCIKLNDIIGKLSIRLYPFDNLKIFQ